MNHDDLDPDGPSEADIEKFGAESRVCPECGSDMYDDSTFCPECGHALIDTTHSGMPKWAMVVVVVVLIAFVLVFVL